MMLRDDDCLCNFYTIYLNSGLIRKVVFVLFCFDVYILSEEDAQKCHTESTQNHDTKPDIEDMEIAYKAWEA